MKKLLQGLLFALLCFVGAGPALAQISDINSAINKAGRERMLSQRMAKVYFQMGQQVVPEQSRKILESSAATFDRQLVELKAYAPTPEIKDTYLKLEKSWQAYKDILLGATPTHANGKKVLELSEEILGIAHQGAVQLEKHSGATAGRLINLAGRQRMLSQRMAKFYQASAWGVADNSVTAELEKMRKEFAAAQQELTNAPANTQAIREGLGLVQQQWFFFDNSLSQRNGNDKRYSLMVATTSERILEEMETVVGLYEKLPPK